MDNELTYAQQARPRESDSQTVRQHYDWEYILSVARDHKRELVMANIIALLATLASVPVPLLMPLLVDEVLLDQPAFVVNTINSLTPAGWHSPALYIGLILLLTLVLRFIALLLNVWQGRQFTLIAKDVIFRIRASL